MNKEPQQNQPSGELRISVLQHTPVPNDTTEALQRIEKAASQASADGCNLLLVPECSVTGYNQPVETMQNVALTDGDKTHTNIAELCAQYQISIVYGFAEHDKGYYYNTVQATNSNGVVVGKYRKTHLWGDLDRTLFTAGDSFTPLFEINGWKTGLLICYDVEFPETVRSLALAGAELILVPTGLMQPWRDVAERVVPVRAYENQVFIAYCNYCGDEAELVYEGRSCIVGPDGQDLARAPKTPVLLTATLIRDAISRNRETLPYHDDRRPDLYHSVSEDGINA